MMMTDHDETALERYFDAAKRVEAQPSDDFMARVVADAMAAMPEPALGVVAAQPAPAGLWTRLTDAIGGWPALGGVMAAGIGGIWIGVAPPANVEDWAASLVGTTETVAFYMDMSDMELEAIDG